MRKFILVILSFFFAFSAYADCTSWTIETTKTESECKASGSITVTLKNAGDLSNIQYSLTGPVNIASSSSNILTNLPKGDYVVRVEAFCQGSPIYKTVSVSIVSSYVDPFMTATVTRNSIDCKATGNATINLNTGVVSSSKKFKVEITKKPSAYTGLTSFESGSRLLYLTGLVSGDYEVQLTDFCGQVLVPEAFNVVKMEISTLVGPGADRVEGKCDQILFSKPYLDNGLWKGLESFIEYSVSADGVTWSEFKTLTQTILYTLPAGLSLKDFYPPNTSKLRAIYRVCTETVNVTARPSFFSFRMYGDKILNCTNFTREFLINRGFVVCYPVKIEIQNEVGTPAFSKTLSLSTHTITVGTDLPFGRYKATYTTGDGYVTTEIIEQHLDANPYTISPVNSIGASYVNDRLLSFTLKSKSSSVFQAVVTLLESPGNSYKYFQSFSGSSSYPLTGNRNVEIGTTEYNFEKGRYKWEVVDKCGTYILEVDVTAADIYTYTMDVNKIEQTCNGAEISFNTTVSGKVSSTSSYMNITDGPYGYSKEVIKSPEGTLLLKIPGKYKFGISQSGSGIYASIPDAYYLYYEFEYTGGVPSAEMSNTQGFACLDTEDDEGQIYIRAINGMAPYTYQLYPKGGAITGTGLMATNTTGDFPPSTLYKMHKNVEYDVKITDQCNASTIQSVKILDLKSAHLVFANKTELCVGETLELTAIALPQPTYNWTGPNGFNTTERTPIIENLGLQHKGKYIVVMNSVLCGVEEFRDEIDVDIKDVPSFTQPPETSVIFSKGNATINISPTVIDYTYNVYSKDGTFIKGEKATTNQLSIVLGEITQTTSYNLKIVGYCESEDDVSVLVPVVDKPHLILLDSCSFMPQLTLNKILGQDIKWEFSENNTTWTNLGTSETLVPTKSGYYKATMSDAGNSFVLNTIKLKITETLVNNRVFYTVLTE